MATTPTAASPAKKRRCLTTTQHESATTATTSDQLSNPRLITPPHTADHVAAELRALVAASIHALALPSLPTGDLLDELLTTVIINGISHPSNSSNAQAHKNVTATSSTKKKNGKRHDPTTLLILKPEDRVRPGAYSSDLAIKLFYKLVKPYQQQQQQQLQQIRSTLSPNTQTNEAASPPTIASAEALAAVLVAAMQYALAPTAASTRQTNRYIVNVSLPNTHAVETHGLHRDRILFQTREFAELVYDNDKDVASTKSLSLADSGAMLTVLYEDDAIVVLDKPANVLSVDGNDESTTALSIQRRVQQLCPAARIVHRLDYETSGVLVVALTRTAAQHLNAQFRDRTVQKTYVATVLGHVDGNAGTIELTMGPHATEQLVQVVIDTVRPLVVSDNKNDNSKPTGRARWTTTYWRVLGRGSSQIDSGSDSCGGSGNSGSSEAFNWTRMELTPVTGRTHQLRVHMQYMGFPILGDSLYSAALVQSKAPRLCLHAAALTVTHPVTLKRLTFSSPSPLSTFQ